MAGWQAGNRERVPRPCGRHGRANNTGFAARFPCLGKPIKLQCRACLPAAFGKKNSNNNLYKFQGFAVFAIWPQKTPANANIKPYYL
jgi:hypothetical protein